MLADSPVRVLVPFTLISLLLGGVQYAAGFGWVKRTATAAPKAPKDAPLEPRAGTIRRSLVALGVIVLALLFTLLYRGELAAIVAGVGFGVGMVDLLSSRWVAQREQEKGITLLRESAASPIAAGRRAVYTLPTRAKTLAT